MTTASRITDGLAKYEELLSRGWSHALAGQQRVVILVYPPDYERKIRKKIGEFQLVTEKAKYTWQALDLTAEPAKWMATEDYRAKYFTQPSLMKMATAELSTRLERMIGAALDDSSHNEQSVLALWGLGSLYNFASIGELAVLASRRLKGLLVLFFPGTHDGNIHKLLGAHAGWNYLAHTLVI